MKVPAAWPPMANHTTSITAKPTTPPVTRAMFGVLCSPWVTHRKCGKNCTRQGVDLPAVGKNDRVEAGDEAGDREQRQDLRPAAPIDNSEAVQDRLAGGAVRKGALRNCRINDEHQEAQRDQGEHPEHDALRHVALGIDHFPTRAVTARSPGTATPQREALRGHRKCRMAGTARDRPVAPPLRRRARHRYSWPTCRNRTARRRARSAERRPG